MLGAMRLSWFTALSFALLAPAALHAAPVASAQPAIGSATLARPAGIRNLNELNFGDLTVTSAGTAVINPDTDAMTTTGGVMGAGGTPYAALFRVEPNRRGAIHIRIPAAPVTITRVGGTESMTVSNWTISSNVQPIGNGRYRFISTLEPFEFKVGGRLNVNANQHEGTYVGNFDVTIDYP